MPKKKSKEEFIKEANLIHNNIYDYSLTEYISAKTDIIIICPEHGKFKQRPDHHLNGSICKKCAIKNRNKKLRSNNEIFIKKANKKHNNFYDYSLVNYINANTPIIITCPNHDKFIQSPNSHLNGSGCPTCGLNKIADKRRMKLNEFIFKSTSIHGDIYDYSSVEYITSIIPVKILCKKHNKFFFMTPNNHISKKEGCPICNESMGEKTIRKILEKYNITFKRQKIFKDCKYLKNLKFDFYLSNYNICIEFDGIQHFKIIDYFGGEKEFKKIKLRDEIKNKYCKENNIKLLRIKYNENINDILNKFLKLYTK